MKKLFLTVFIVIFAFSAEAQQVVSHHADSTHLSSDHPVGWMRSHILDNWFFDLQGGGQLYYGYQDRLGPMKERLTGKAEFKLGRWIFPTLGIRGGVGIANSRGYISLDTYLANRPQLTADFGTCHGTSTSTTVIGNETIRGAFGGYYFPVEGNNTLLMQDWRYLYGGFDLLLNLSNLKPQNKVNLKKRWNNIFYAGFHIRYGITEFHPERSNNTNAANEGHIGYIASLELTKHITLHGDLRLSIMEGDFDRERLIGVEPFQPDLELSAMVGLNYNFHLRTNKMRRNYYVERGWVPYNTIEVPKFIDLYQIEDLRTFVIVDTILVHIKDTADDPNIKRLIDSLEDELDNLLLGVPRNMPFDSILLKQLLPYEMVFFDLDKWDIRPSEEQKIARMARVMKAYPKGIFHLYGSADAKTGTVKRNTFLSHNRADMVYNRLILEYGIKPEQLRRDYLGGIMDYEPFMLNRTTVIIMEHPSVQEAFEKMKAQHRAGGGVVEIDQKQKQRRR